MLIKPSELAPASSRILEALISKYMDQYAIRLVTAGPKEMQPILERRFNHIFSTGSATVAKHIAAAAAKHLTPIVLLAL